MRAAGLALLALLAGCGEEARETGPRVRDCRLHVRFAPAGQPGDIGISSDFNGFDASRGALRWDGEAFSGAFEVAPGRHLYRVEVDGRPFLDPDNPVSLWEAGAEWSVFDAPDCAQPAFTLAAIEHADGAPSARLVLERADAQSGLATVQAFVDDAPVAAEVDGDEVRPELRAAPGKHHLRLEGTDAAGRPVETFTAPYWAEAERFRWEDAVIYQVVLDRFARTTPFTPADRLRPPGERQGGDLRGLLGVLESGYFETLGVDALWISPLNTNPEGLWTGVEGGPPRYSSYHGYWPIAPRAVDPRLGTDADVEALVQAAHARGIRVILDVVLNHVHAQHPYARERPDWLNPLCACGSPACPWQTHIRTCWFTPYLPDISWESSEVLEAQIDDALWWLERFDLDGLRVDAVPMMPRFVTRHLTHQVHARLEGLRTRYYLVGETYTGTNGIGDIRWSLGPAGLDGQFDFPVMWTLRRVFAWEEAPLWVLADVWQQTAAAWAGSTAVMGVFAGNHDVTRFLSEAAGQVDGRVYDQAWRAPPPIPDDPVPYARLRLAQAFALTVPGAPVLYYGDEFGLPGVGDPDNRRPMRFGGERTPLEQATARVIGRLGRLRRCLPALRRGTWRLLRAEAERLAYLRDAGDGAPAVVVLARRPASGTVSLDVPAGVPAWREVLSGVEVAAEGGRVTLTMAARTPAVLVPAGHACAREGGE
ncbi:MAG: hypothetical protein H6706_14050 [Myxococcales bacterium]|nr:hypothetical protein [Myxococcales bacterium]